MLTFNPVHFPTDSQPLDLSCSGVLDDIIYGTDSVSIPVRMDPLVKIPPLEIINPQAESSPSPSLPIAT